MIKYMILGANGLIGRQFARLCDEQNIPWVGTRYSREANGLIHFDLMELDRMPAVLDDVSPTVLINATGLAGGVNFCQDNPGTGTVYHVESTKVMADWCKKNNAAYAFISTDYVFDGKNPPYKENDPVNPLNLYGKYKLQAEQYIRTHLERYVIARTTNVFGWDPLTQTPNFLMFLFQTLAQKDTMKVPAFLYGNPTYAGDLAAGITDLIQKENFGLYHIVGPENINRYHWATLCLEMSGLTGKTLERIDTPPPNMVPRPLHSNLDTTKFQQASKVKLHNVRQGLEIFVSHLNQDPAGIRPI